MMMTKMAKKLDIGGSGTIRPDGFESRGGGRRSGKPFLQYKLKELEGWMLLRKSETSCRPEGWWDHTLLMASSLCPSLEALKEQLIVGRLARTLGRELQR